MNVVEAVRAEMGMFASKAKARRVALAVLRSIRDQNEAQYEALNATGLMWREQTSQSVWRVQVDALISELVSSQ